MGMGRSGTTILDVLLGNCPGAASGGELTHFFRDALGWEGRCGCGSLAVECPIWSEVIRLGGWDRSAAGEAARLLHKVEWHTRFPLLAGGVGRRVIQGMYRELNEKLFSAVAQATDSQVVVDSSKYPGRALALSWAFLDRVRLVAVVRSPAGLVASFAKPNVDEQWPKRPLVVAFYYTYLLFCIWAVKRLLRNEILVLRYEDLVSDPESTLTRLERWTGLDTSHVRRVVRDKGLLKVGHILTGNRLRKEKFVRFDPPRGGETLDSNEARLSIRVMVWVERLVRLT